MTSIARKGASRSADISPQLLSDLSQGLQPTLTLTECLAVDQAQLIRVVFPELSEAALASADAACELGILKRMNAIGALLLEQRGTEAIAQCQAHPADTVRGWACFMIGLQPGLDLASRLDAVRTLADDAHFGVREWAWMALRPHLVAKLDDAIAALRGWTTSPSERLRRFACESLRPRGVWCAHIAELKQQPERALPILTPLRADPSVYVQDSVANWLNDAAKDQPAWVRSLCAQWLEATPNDATQRIVRRAVRNLK